MGQPISVSAAEFARLEQLKAMQETGQRKSGPEVAGDAMKFGKKLALGWIITSAVLFLIGCAFVLPWMTRGFGQLDQMHQRTQAAMRDPVGTLMPQQYASVTAESDRALMNGTR